MDRKSKNIHVLTPWGEPLGVLVSKHSPDSHGLLTFELADFADECDEITLGRLGNSEYGFTVCCSSADFPIELFIPVLETCGYMVTRRERVDDDEEAIARFEKMSDRQIGPRDVELHEEIAQLKVDVARLRDRLESKTARAQGMEDRLRLERDQYERERDALRAVVGDLEWSDVDDVDLEPCCPKCHRPAIGDTHDPDCALRTALEPSGLAATAACLPHPCAAPGAVCDETTLEEIERDNECDEGSLELEWRDGLGPIGLKPTEEV